MAGPVPPVPQLWGGGSTFSKIQEQTTNALFKVRDIIAACRQDRAIELVVSRDSALTARRNHPREGLGEAELARWVRKLKLSHIIVPPILGRRFTHLNLETWAVGYRCDMKHWFKLIFFWFPVPPSSVELSSLSSKSLIIIIIGAECKKSTWQWCLQAGLYFSHCN